MTRLKTCNCSSRSLLHQLEMRTMSLEVSEFLAKISSSLNVLIPHQLISQPLPKMFALFYKGSGWGAYWLAFLCFGPGERVGWHNKLLKHWLQTPQTAPASRLHIFCWFLRQPGKRNWHVETSCLSTAFHHGDTKDLAWSFGMSLSLDTSCCPTWLNACETWIQMLPKSKENKASSGNFELKKWKGWHRSLLKVRISSFWSLWLLVKANAKIAKAWHFVCWPFRYLPKLTWKKTSSVLQDHINACAVILSKSSRAIFFFFAAWQKSCSCSRARQYIICLCVSISFYICFQKRNSTK